MLAGMPQKGGQRIVVQPELRGSVAHQEEPLFLRAVGGQRLFRICHGGGFELVDTLMTQGLRAESSKVLRPNSVRRARPAAATQAQVSLRPELLPGGVSQGRQRRQPGQYPRSDRPAWHVWRAAAFPGLVCVSVPAPGSQHPDDAACTYIKRIDELSFFHFSRIGVNRYSGRHLPSQAICLGKKAGSRLSMG